MHRLLKVLEGPRFAKRLSAAARQYSKPNGKSRDKIMQLTDEIALAAGDPPCLLRSEIDRAIIPAMSANDDEESVRLERLVDSIRSELHPDQQAIARTREIYVTTVLYRQPLRLVELLSTPDFESRKVEELNLDAADDRASSSVQEHNLTHDGNFYERGLRWQSDISGPCWRNSMCRWDKRMPWVTDEDQFYVEARGFSLGAFRELVLRVEAAIDAILLMIASTDRDCFEEDYLTHSELHQSHDLLKRCLEVWFDCPVQKRRQGSDEENEEADRRFRVQFRTSMELLGLAAKADHPGVCVALSCAAMEAVLVVRKTDGPAKKAGDTIADRFSRRLSTLLQPIAKERKVAERLASRVYQARSDLMHGNKVESNRALAANVLMVGRCCSRAILQWMGSSGPMKGDSESHRSFIDVLDQCWKNEVPVPGVEGYLSKSLKAL